MAADAFSTTARNRASCSRKGRVDHLPLADIGKGNDAADGPAPLADGIGPAFHRNATAVLAPEELIGRDVPVLLME